MKIGDLVRYVDRTDPRYKVGLVLLVRQRACLVRWGDGFESSHGKQWLIKLKTSETL